jgi:hypothetical protein
VWLAWQNRAGNRWAKFAVFAIAAVIPFAPEIWILVQSPAVTRFNVIDYHLLYRQVQWPGAISHDLGVMISWVDCGDALMLGALAIAALWFIHFQSDWTFSVRAEYYLCAALAIVLSAQILTAHPTFQRYFIFAVPFLAILASAGLYFGSSRLQNTDRRLWPVLAVAVVSLVDLSKVLHDRADNFEWSDIERIAAKIDQVTPANGAIFADEQIFFVTRRPPTPGMELADSHKLEMPPDLAAQRHILPSSVLERQVKAKRFDTIQTCGDDEQVEKWGYAKLYHEKAEIEDCTVYWGK